MLKKYLDYIRNNPKRYWFKAKWFGWGWTPATWEGWLTTGVLILAIILLSRRANGSESFLELMYEYLIPIALLTALFIIIARMRGEKPRWRWGDRSRRKKKQK